MKASLLDASVCISLAGRRHTRRFLMCTQGDGQPYRFLRVCMLRNTAIACRLQNLASSNIKEPQGSCCICSFEVRFDCRFRGQIWRVTVVSAVPQCFPPCLSPRRAPMCRCFNTIVLHVRMLRVPPARTRVACLLGSRLSCRRRRRLHGLALLVVVILVNPTRNFSIER